MVCRVMDAPGALDSFLPETLMKNTLTARLTAAALGLVLLAPWYAGAQPVEEEPSFMAMTGDLLVARPLLLVTSVVGTAAFLVSLPFTVAGENTGQAAQTLVVGPLRETLARCLGCRTSTASAAAPDRD